MWYAQGHIEQPAPIVRFATPAGATPSQRAGPPARPLPPTVVKGSVFEMPAGLPPFLKKQVIVPVADETSEFAAVQSVALQISTPFTHKGPDYALVGTSVPFGKPCPAYEFLWYIGESYVPGTLNINGSGAIAAINQKSKQ